MIIYLKKDVNSVDLIEMSKNIISEIFMSSVSPDKKIEFEVDLPEKLFYPSSKAISISLVLNEILNNTIKHAFTEKDFGNVFLTIKITDIDELIIILSDDGKGMDKSFLLKNMEIWAGK